MLHVGLRHDMRRLGRDPYLWNVACDFAINAWLTEMRIGQMPESALLDPQLAGLSAEDIYHLIVSDLRRFRKLATLRGQGLRDMVGSATNETGACVGTDLDAFDNAATPGSAAGRAPTAWPTGCASRAGAAPN